MAEVIDKRVTAEIEGDFVVFLIGMRINKLWKLWKWLPVFFAMPRLLRELADSPQSGFLGAAQYMGSPRRPMLVQYWRSFEQLEAYARNRDAAHWPAWVAFNKRIGSSGDVGIWHETYLPRRQLRVRLQQHAAHRPRGGDEPGSGRRSESHSRSRAGVRDEPYPDEVPTDGIESESTALLRSDEDQ